MSTIKRAAVLTDSARPADLSTKFERLHKDLERKERHVREARQVERLAEEEGAFFSAKNRASPNKNGRNTPPTGRETVPKHVYVEMESELTEHIRHVETEKTNVKRELRSKLDDRDTTISALVKSSVTQEQKVSKLQNDMAQLRGKLQEAMAKDKSPSYREDSRSKEKDNMELAVGRLRPLSVVDNC